MSDENETNGSSFDVLHKDYSRRDVLKGAAIAGAAMGLGPLLAACGGGGTSATSAAPSASVAASPKMGGVLRAGITGGSSSDTFDALAPVTQTDYARILQVYQPLFEFDQKAESIPCLAEDMTPNADATVWTIRLRAGVTWHDGKPLTPEDVMYTFRRILDPKNPTPGMTLIGSVDTANMKKIDATTLQVGCTAPFSTFPQAAATIGYVPIVPDGYDPKAPPNGTGPFMADTFNPGQQTTLKRNPNYWQSGQPYLDQVVITNYPDETAQTNALAGGQVDVVNTLSTDILSALTSQGKKVLISPGGGWTPFTMRVDAAPFTDVRVRQAMRLIVDRPQMMELVFAGHGTVGNDVFSIWDPDYDTQLPQRTQDIEQAKSLLKAAGREGLTVELRTADVAQGVVKAAQVFAQQAKAAGVTVNLVKTTVTDFYGTNYLKWIFAQDYWWYTYYLPQAAECIIPGAPYNETHWNDPRTNSLYADALKTVDVAKRTEIVHELQKIDYDEGGYIIPYFPPVIDGYAPNVNGLVPSKVGSPLNEYAFKNLWLS
jgi:peptide/nickel transport system substrate-binding protein